MKNKILVLAIWVQGPNGGQRKIIWSIFRDPDLMKQLFWMP